MRDHSCYLVCLYTVVDYDIPGVEKVDRCEARGPPRPGLELTVKSMAFPPCSAAAEGDGYSMGERLPD